MMLSVLSTPARRKGRERGRGGGGGGDGDGGRDGEGAWEGRRL